ncbi:MAG: glycosyltransferase family 4 protein [Gammaproteobacteria bacterium]|nr:glycosyltransferase family 4 protein [Gammaproteobacteria bacterium]MBU1972419.1 glycosyltransferase family 4 protein [Gammaproteobacteria bacterium]
MNILVVSQYFWPENFRVNELVAGLVERGHVVTVLTGQPNYPDGRFPPGYGWRGRRREKIFGAEIIRVPLVARGDGIALRLALNYLSFALFASIAACFRIRGAVDVIIVFEPSPITVGIPAVVAAHKFRAPILFWVLDLWPASLAAAGAVRSPAVLRGVGHLVRWIYRQCARVLVPSRAFITDVVSYGTPPQRVRYFPNWIESEYASDNAEHPVDVVLPSGFRVVFAGNIGAAQGFPEIIAAAERVAAQCAEVRWIIVGDGRMAEWAREEVARRGLADRVVFLGQLPSAKMPALFAEADALLVSLKSDPVFSLTIPGKVQSYLAAGRPVLAMLDGEGARIVAEAGAGLVCAAGDVEGLAAHVCTLVGKTPAERAAMGSRGRDYARAEFAREPLFDRLESWCEEAIAEMQHGARK